MVKVEKKISEKDYKIVDVLLNKEFSVQEKNALVSKIRLGIEVN